MKISVVFFLSCLSYASAGPLADLFIDALNSLVEFFADIDGEKADDYLDDLADTVCGATFKVLEIEGLKCACTSNLVEGSNSAVGAMNCTIAEGCIESDLFCGEGEIDGSIQAGEFGIALHATSCFVLDVGLLPEKIDEKDNYEICVDASSEPGKWGFSSCSATIRGEWCECDPCGGFGITFDCSSINISPTPDLFTISGPNMKNICSRLDFTPKETDDKDKEWKEKDDKEWKDKDDKDKESKDGKHM